MNNENIIKDIENLNKEILKIRTNTIDKVDEINEKFFNIQELFLNNPENDENTKTEFLELNKTFCTYHTDYSQQFLDYYNEVKSLKEG